MPAMLVGKGTVLNTATVVGGAAIGLLIGRFIPDRAMTLVLAGLGLVTFGLGVGMFLKSKNPLLVAVAIAVGGILGVLIGCQAGIEAFSKWAEATFAGSGGGRFAEAVLTTSLLYCVGPMTVLGCIQDGVEGKSDLLAIKSTMDGIGSIFFAAALGPGVFVTAGVVLVFQGLLTNLAGLLKPLAKREDLLSDMGAAGGVMLMGIGLGLVDIKHLPIADFLPALAIGPVLEFGILRLGHRKSRSDEVA